MNFSKMSNLNLFFESGEMTATLSFYLSEAETATFISLVTLFGTVRSLENLVLILSIIMPDQFADTPSNIFVLSLAFADLLVWGVSAPLFIYNCFNPVFKILMNVSRFNAVATTGSIFTLSLDRDISLIIGLKYPKIMTFQRTVGLVAGAWVAASFVVISAAIGLVCEIQPLVIIARYFLGFCISATIVMYI